MITTTTTTIIITRIRSKITKIIILRITMEIKSKKNLEKWKKKKQNPQRSP